MTKDLLDHPWLYPDFRVRLRGLVQDVKKITGLEIRATDGFRTQVQQAKLYSSGRTVPGVKHTNAKPGWSWHNYGLACDFCFRGQDPYLSANPKRDELWEGFGKAARGLGLVWGGDFRAFKDRPHIELAYGLTLAECYELHNFGGLAAVWTMVDKIRGVKAEWKDGDLPLAPLHSPVNQGGIQ